MKLRSRGHRAEELCQKSDSADMDELRRNMNRAVFNQLGKRATVPCHQCSIPLQSRCTDIGADLSRSAKGLAARTCRTNQ